MANVREIQKAIFGKLVDNTSLTLAGFPLIRIYLTEEEHNSLASDVHLLATYIFNRQVCFVLLEVTGKTFFLTIGINKELTTSELVACDNQKTLSMVSVATSKIERLTKVSESDLENNIFIDSTIEDVEWGVIESFFPLIMTYEVATPIGTTRTEYQAVLKHLSLYALTCCPEVLILPFEPATLNKYAAIINLGDKNIPEDNLLQSLGSNYWRFCYVDVYRCIERLYRLGLVHNFKNSLSSSLPIDDLHTKLKERFLMKTGVESHEDTNLAYLLLLLSPATKNVLNPVRNGMNHENYVYRLRNIIVHYQKNEAELEAIDDVKWNIIIRFLLSAITELYPVFTSYIAALPDE